MARRSHKSEQLHADPDLVVHPDHGRRALLAMLQWAAEAPAAPGPIRLDTAQAGTVAHHSGFSRRSVLARSSTDGHNAPEGDACVASFSRASKAL